MTFSATLRRTGSVCSATKTDAHAALADLLQQLVRADDACRAASPTGRLVRRVAVAVRGGRLLQEAAGAWSCAASSCLDAPPQAGVAAAGLVQVGGAAAAARSISSAARKSRSLGSRQGMAALGGNRPSRDQCDAARASCSRNRRTVRPLVRPGRQPLGAARPGRSAQCRSAVAGEMPRASAACSHGQAGEVAELDQLGLGRVVPRPARRAPRPGPAARRVRLGDGSRRRRGRPGPRPPPRFSGSACGGRPRRGCGAWPRRRRRRSGRGRSTAGRRRRRRAGGRPRGPGRWPGASGRASPAPAAGRPACAARRRRAAGVARRPGGRPARWRTGCASRRTCLRR